jgi:AraC-like DNA-binding protein
VNDFASAAMLRLVALGLRRQGIALPAMAPADGAHVPLADKRALLEGLLNRHGEQVLLRIGEAAADARDEPVAVALTMARDPHDLLARWKRLERFVHSRHHLDVVQDGAQGLVLHHVSRHAGQPPTRAEDLLVVGLLVALMQRLGTQGLRARLPGEASWRFDGACWSEAPLPDDCSRWSLQWRALVQAPREPPAGAHEAVAIAHRLLAADPSRRWTVQALAREMALSTRSLQRSLSEGGSCFSDLLTHARLGVSARLLVQTGRSPAEVAYACGFADQAHLGRTFKRHSALTPGRYREAFKLAEPRSG